MAGKFSQSRTMRSGWISRGLMLLLVFVLGVFIARLPITLAQLSKIRGGPVTGSTSEPIEAIREVLELLERDAVEKPDIAKLQRGAIDGMLESLDDAYAEYVPAEESQEFDKALTGQYVGIGCQVETREGWLTIVSPMEDSPAFKGGIMAGDRVTKINEESTFGLPIDQCIKKLTGEPGTNVTISVLRDGQDLTFTLARAKIISKSVRGVRRMNDGSGHWDYVLDPATKTAYVRMSQFTPTSPRELLSALSEVEQNAGDVGGLILDLRGNPGGFMEAALEIADFFLDDGVIMSTRGRGTPERFFKATGGNTLPNFPIAILVNGGSASASEIVSGALSDRGRAIVIGTRTFGKGLVQTVHQVDALPNAEMKFTTQRYYLPSGRLIQRMDDSTTWGVDPTPGFYAPVTDKELLAWALWRRDQDIVRKSTGAEERWNDPSWIENTAKDKQLAMALRAITTRIASGAWKPEGEVEHQNVKIATRELKALEKTRDRLNKEALRLDKRIESLELAAEGAAKPLKPIDLWADSLDLTDGHVDVTDKDGKRIARLKVTGRDLERWLASADVELEPATGDSTKPAAEAAAPGTPSTPASTVPPAIKP